MTKLLDRLKEHTTSIYAFLFTLIITSSLLIFQEIKHASELIKLHQQQGLLVEFIDERDKLIIEQREAMIDTEDEMNDLKAILSSQQAFIEKIILYLKRIGHWPPKIPPNELNDGDNNRSEA